LPWRLVETSETKTRCQEIARKPTCFFAQSPLFKMCETRTKVYAHENNRCNEFVEFETSECVYYRIEE